MNVSDFRGEVRSAASRIVTAVSLAVLVVSCYSAGPKKDVSTLSDLGEVWLGEDNVPVVDPPNMKVSKKNKARWFSNEEFRIEAKRSTDTLRPTCTKKNKFWICVSREFGPSEVGAIIPYYVIIIKGNKEYKLDPDIEVIE